MDANDPIFSLVLQGSLAVLVGIVLYTLALLVEEIALKIKMRIMPTGDWPTAEELAEIEELRRPGTLNLGGRESAAARHFEAPIRQNPISRYGGGRTVESPPSEAVVKQWRDQRTER